MLNVILLYKLNLHRNCITQIIRLNTSVKDDSCALRCCILNCSRFARLVVLPQHANQFLRQLQIPMASLGNSSQSTPSVYDRVFVFCPPACSIVLWPTATHLGQNVRKHGSRTDVSKENLSGEVEVSKKPAILLQIN